MNRLLLSLCCASLGCAGESAPTDTALTPTDPVVALAEPGPYTVGYREMSFEWTPSIGTDGQPRSHRLAVWYPTNAEPTDDARYMGLFPAPGVAIDAPLAEGVGQMPVVVYSHGHQGYAEASGFLVTHLASRGWLVVAPDHTTNTTFDLPARTTEIYFLRPMDISAVLDLLADTDDPILSNAGTPVLAVGHSFGGYTLTTTSGAAFDMDTWSVDCANGSANDFCATMNDDYEATFRAGLTEPRIDATLLMAPGNFNLFGPTGAAALTTPTLMMTGDLDGQVTNIDNGDPLWAAIEGPGHVRVNLRHGGHMTFSDFSGTLDQGDNLVSPEEGWRIINVYATAWALSLLGDDQGASVLDGSAEVSDQVDVWAP